MWYILTLSSYSRLLSHNEHGTLTASQHENRRKIRYVTNSSASVSLFSRTSPSSWTRSQIFDSCRSWLRMLASRAVLSCSDTTSSRRLATSCWNTCTPHTAVNISHLSRIAACCCITRTSLFITARQVFIIFFALTKALIHDFTNISQASIMCVVSAYGRSETNSGVATRGVARNFIWGGINFKD